MMETVWNGIIKAQSCQGVSGRMPGARIGMPHLAEDLVLPYPNPEEGEDAKVEEDLKR